MSNSHNSSASVVDVTVCPLQGRRKANDTPEKCVACVNPKENHKGYTVEKRGGEEGNGYCPSHNHAQSFMEALVSNHWRFSIVRSLSQSRTRSQCWIFCAGIKARDSVRNLNAFSNDSYSSVA